MGQPCPASGVSKSALSALSSMQIRDCCEVASVSNVVALLFARNPASVSTSVCSSLSRFLRLTLEAVCLPVSRIGSPLLSASAESERQFHTRHCLNLQICSVPSWYHSSSTRYQVSIPEPLLSSSSANNLYWSLSALRCTSTCLPLECAPAVF